MHRNEVVTFSGDSRADSPELLHVATGSQEQADVDAKGADVGAGLAGDPKDAEILGVVELEQLALVDGADAEAALHGGDEGRALEEGSSERLDGAGQVLLGGGRVEGQFVERERVVEADDADVLLSSRLLRLDQAGGPVHAHDQATRHLGVQRAGGASLLYLEDSANPRRHLVTAWITGFIQIDHPITKVLQEREEEEVSQRGGKEEEERRRRRRIIDVHTSLMGRFKGE